MPAFILFCRKQRSFAKILLKPVLSPYMLPNIKEMLLNFHLLPTIADLTV